MDAGVDGGKTGDLNGKGRTAAEILKNTGLFALRLLAVV
jgi:hypothetical protein